MNQVHPMLLTIASQRVKSLELLLLALMYLNPSYFLASVKQKVKLNPPSSRVSTFSILNHGMKWNLLKQLLVNTTKRLISLSVSILKSTFHLDKRVVCITSHLFLSLSLHLTLVFLFFSCEHVKYYILWFTFSFLLLFFLSLSSCFFSSTFHFRFHFLLNVTFSSRETRIIVLHFPCDPHFTLFFFFLFDVLLFTFLSPSLSLSSLID